MKNVAIAIATVAVASCAGCDKSLGLTDSSSIILFRVDGGVARQTGNVVDFGTVLVDGTSRTGTISVLNVGAVALETTWTKLYSPFAATLPSRLVPGTTPLTITLTATEPKKIDYTVTVSADGVNPAQFRILANISGFRACDNSNECVVSTFQTDTKTCQSTFAQNGTACDAGLGQCASQATCTNGSCSGILTSCDDKNACTVDACQPLVGCEFLPAPPCPSEGACMVGTCDPQKGCGLTPAADGTPCGPEKTCQAVQICMSGKCVTRKPPEGYVCEETSPCRLQGRCTEGTCIHTEADTQRTLTPAWDYDSQPPTSLIYTVPYHDFVVERSGAVTMGNWFQGPMLVRANTPDWNETTEGYYGATRRCILWNERLLCADYPHGIGNHDGTISSIDLKTATTLWTYDVYEQEPQIAKTERQMYLARVVVQASDRLAAVFESQPFVDAGDPRLNSGSPDDGEYRCRDYFLVVLNALGQGISIQPIQDPFLLPCYHPHPYGVASDSVGNLYIAFSPTFSRDTPLLPENRTLILSYTRDGIFRWRRYDDTMRGGEMAIARSLLYPENTPSMLDARTGQVTATLPANLGRLVVANDLAIPAPTSEGTTVSGYQAGATTLRWTHKLPAGETFWGEQLRLATWQTSLGPQTIALTITRPQGSTSTLASLYAIDIRNGLKAFACPIQLTTNRTEPQLMEVYDGGIVIMNGAVGPDGSPSCLKCDPPLAQAYGAFQTYSLPGITPSNDRWVGTFGGAGHDGQEKAGGPK